VEAAFLDGLVLTPWEDGSEDLFTRAEAATVHRCGGPLLSVLRWSQPLVRLPLAEVVASAVGAIRATCC
jgi:hypothetical protein